MHKCKINMKLNVFSSNTPHIFTTSHSPITGMDIRAVLVIHTEEGKPSLIRRWGPHEKNHAGTYYIWIPIILEN